MLESYNLKRCISTFYLSLAFSSWVSLISMQISLVTRENSFTPNLHITLHTYTASNWHCYIFCTLLSDDYCYLFVLSNNVNLHVILKKKLTDTRKSIVREYRMWILLSNRSIHARVHVRNTIQKHDVYCNSKDRLVACNCAASVSVDSMDLYIQATYQGIWHWQLYTGFAQYRSTCGVSLRERVIYTWTQFEAFTVNCFSR